MVFEQFCLLCVCVLFFFYFGSRARLCAMCVHFLLLSKTIITTAITITKTTKNADIIIIIMKIKNKPTTTQHQLHQSNNKPFLDVFLCVCVCCTSNRGLIHEITQCLRFTSNNVTLNIEKCNRDAITLCPFDILFI